MEPVQSCQARDCGTFTFAGLLISVGSRNSPRVEEGSNLPLPLALLIPVEVRAGRCNAELAVSEHLGKQTGKGAVAMNVLGTPHWRKFGWFWFWEIMTMGHCT